MKVIEYEREQKEVLVQEYIARGYEILEEPRFVISGVRPDILARNIKTKEILIIEVINFNSIKKDLVQRVKVLQELFPENDNVKFEFRYIDVPLAAEIITREEAQRTAKKPSKRSLQSLKPINTESKWYSPTVSLTSDWTRLARLLRASNSGNNKQSILEIYNDLVAQNIIKRADEQIDSVDKSIFDIFDHVNIVMEGGSVDNDIVRQMREHLTSVQAQLLPDSKAPDVNDQDD